MASVVEGVVGVFVKPAVNFCLPDGVDVSTAVNKKKSCCKYCASI